MIFVVMFLISLVSVCVKADIIISVAAKQSKTVHTTTTNTEAISHTIEPLKKPKGVKETYTSDYSSDTKSNTSKNIDLGILVQYSHCSGIIAGVGLFQDQTGMATLGWRFE